MMTTSIKRWIIGAIAFMMFPVFLMGASFQETPSTYVKLSTSYGSCIIRLYNETPKHRDNFIKLVKEHFYDGLLFHRVIKDFMIQGGDPNSKDAKPGALLGSGGGNELIPAEFNKKLFHKKGALAAARNNNPQKGSSSSQFYIVEGKTYTDEELNQIEASRGETFSPEEREHYKTKGGTPFLDQEYTVFGEVVKGLEMVDKISEIKTDKNNRPEKDISMKMEILSTKDVQHLEKELNSK